MGKISNCNILGEYGSFYYAATGSSAQDDMVI